MPPPCTMPRYCRQRLAIVAACIGGLTFAQAATPALRIVNGNAAVAGAYPWFVTVYSNGGECGGSVIHPRWILTAAHCFDPGQAPSAVSIVAGRDKLSAVGTGQLISAKRFIQHPQYDGSSIDNDIALIELSSNVNAQVVKLMPPAFPLPAGTISRAIGRGTLASPGYYLGQVLDLAADCDANISRCITEARALGKSDADIITLLLQANGLGDPTLGIGYPALVKELKAAGGDPGSSTPSVATLVSKFTALGERLSTVARIILDAATVTDEIREVDLPLVSNAICEQSTQLAISDNMLCAGYVDTPKDTCQGDSGGPLVTRNRQNSDWLQLGIVSFGNACATNYGVYTRVSRYLDWIGQYVPHFNDDRVFTWGELAAAPSILQASGSERSTDAYPPYWARLYATSNTVLGVNSQDQHLYWYANGKLNDLGAISGWLSQAKAAGY